MEKLIIHDSNGDHLVVQTDGNRLWPSSMKYVSSAKEFKAQPDDIFLCSYSRSGTHWAWELIRMLLTNELHHLDSSTKMDAMLEYVGCEHLETKPSPRVFNTHLNYHLLPPDIFNKNCKIVLLCRNPKDVALSYYHFIKSRKHYEYEGKFDGFLELFNEGKVPYESWFDYTQEWDAAIKGGIKNPLLVVYYEQLKQNFVETVSEMCTFLGVSRPLEFLYQMETITSFDSFKRSLDATYDEKEFAEWKDRPQFIHKGIIGNWKNWFTVAQNENFDDICRDRLRNSIFKFTFEPHPAHSSKSQSSLTVITKDNNSH